jgi:hypothetical protein
VGSFTYIIRIKFTSSRLVTASSSGDSSPALTMSSLHRLITLWTLQKSKSESKLLYDWRFTASQFILVSSPLRLTVRDLFFFNRALVVIVLMYHPLWRKDGFASSSNVGIAHIACYRKFFLLHYTQVNTGFTEQIMSMLRILCYNGSLVTWTVVSLTTAKSKPLIFHRVLWTLAPVVLLIIFRHGPSRKHRSFLYSSRFHGSIPYYFAKALFNNNCIYLLIKSLLLSSGCYFVVCFVVVTQ